VTVGLAEVVGCLNSGSTPVVGIFAETIEAAGLIAGVSHSVSLNGLADMLT